MSAIQQPSELIANSRLSAFQIFCISVCVLINALDGFDTLAISFAAPQIAADWQISPGMLGVVLTFELWGLIAGSIIVGNVADKVGRHPVILGCLCAMSLGMFGSMFATNIETLFVFRVITGLGIGGMMPSIASLVSEYANDRSRDLAIAVMGAGFPAGALIGGIASAKLLEHYDWRAVFLLGGTATFLLIPLVYFFLPESIQFLAKSRRRNALSRINATLKKMNKEALTKLVSVKGEGVKEKIGFQKLFSEDVKFTTVMLTSVYFLNIATYYYIMKWVPKIVVDLGYSPAEAGSVLAKANIGAVVGAILIGLLSRRINIGLLVIGALLLGAGSVVFFGFQASASLPRLTVVTGFAVFFITSAIVGTFALFARHFPTEARASGIGFAAGVGRGGMVVGPILAGGLFAAGVSLANVSAIMAIGSAAAACVLFWFQRNVKG